jgi:hypothetical protein
MSPVDVSPKPPVAPAYLGDGVYASYDGCDIRLCTRIDSDNQVIYLEQAVYSALVVFARQVWGEQA